MLLHKHVDVVDTRFSTTSVPLANNTLGKLVVVIRRGSYQAAAEDSRWAYETVSDLWPDMVTDSDSSVDGSSDEGGKYQKNLDDQEQEVVSYKHRNTRSIVRGGQRSLRNLKS